MPRKAAACDTSPDIKRSTVQPKDDLNPANCPIFASAGSQGNLGWIDMDSVAPYMTYDPMNQYFGRGIWDWPCCVFQCWGGIKGSCGIKNDDVVEDDENIYSKSMPLMSITMYGSVGLTSCLVAHHSQPVNSPQVLLVTERELTYPHVCHLELEFREPADWLGFLFRDVCNFSSLSLLSESPSYIYIYICRL